ncbi:KR domain-containing protein [Hypoxylon sp. NC1633]|nr:KR domain-containing protein [Hypoxylon sp. NC1633]
MRGPFGRFVEIGRILRWPHPGRYGARRGPLLRLDIWNAAVAPEFAGSYNLHSLLLVKGMDFFVMFSSIASRGLSNYAAGNAFQDSIARYRVAQIERATAFDLKPIYEVGWMADKLNLQALYKRITNGPVTQAEFGYRMPDCGDKGGRRRPDGFLSREGDFSSLASDVGLGRIENGSVDVPGTKSGGGMDLMAALTRTTTLAAGTQAVTEALAQKMAITLALERHELDASIPDYRYGVDSLVAVELRNWLAKTIHSEVAILNFMGGVSVEGNP